MSLTVSYEPSTYTLFAQEDKLAHFIMYLIMSFLLGKSIKKRGKWHWVLIFVLPACYGFFMEILQDWMGAGRQFEFFDILANIFGSFTGTMLIYMLYKLKSGSRQIN